jgi:hypothetical protein
MHGAVLMGELQSARSLLAYREGSADLERRLTGDDISEVASCHELHDDVRYKVVTPDVVDGDDIPVDGKAGNQPCFTLEGANDLRVVHESPIEDFHCDNVLHASIPGAEDMTTVAAADVLEYLVARVENVTDQR